MPQAINKRSFKDVVDSHYKELEEMPAKLFHPYRIIIMDILARFGSVEYRQLKHDIPNITDGNLGGHLRALADEDYIKIHKEIIDMKPRTTYELTPKGMREFEKFKNYMKALIEIA